MFVSMYKLIFYVPKDQAEAVKNAVFLSGAGQLGAYAHCSWETEGMGQFKPLPGANPTLGEIDHLQRVPELRVEILCQKDTIREAIVRLKQAHPYEEVAFEVLSVENHKFS